MICEKQLVALDHFRCGRVGRGLHCLGIEGMDLYTLFDVVSYEVDPQLFKQDMRNIAEFLQEMGY